MKQDRTASPNRTHLVPLGAPKPRPATAVERNAAATRQADLDVFRASRGEDDFPGSAAVAAAFEEFARSAAELPGAPAMPLIVQVGLHTVALQLTEDAADLMAKWVHHMANAAKNRASIEAEAQELADQEALNARRPALRLVPTGGAR